MANRQKLEGGGWFHQTEEGSYVCFSVTRPQDGRGLYKVWIWGSGGKILLGTMMPQGGQLELVRRISRKQLVRAGCYPVVGGEAVLAFSFGQEGRQSDVPEGWRWEQTLAGRLQDRVLSQGVEGRKFLFRQETGGFSLMIPYGKEEEFPLVPIFCLCSTIVLEKRRYLLWKFDHNGSPII